MIRALIQFIIIIALIGGTVHFTPSKIKEKASQKISRTVAQLIPDSIEQKIQEKADPFIHTPIERRARILAQLRENINTIEKALLNDPLSEKTEKDAKELSQKLSDTRELVEKMENLNTEQGLVNKITTTIFDEVTGKTKETQILKESLDEPNCSLVCAKE